MLLNIIGFNIAWFGLVLVGNPFILVTLLLLALHLYYCKQRLAECKLILAVAVIGILTDSTLLALHVFHFNGQAVIPFWLMMLWVAFAATIAHSLHFLSRSKSYQLGIGFLFPPLSYIGGSSLTDLSLGYGLIQTYLILALIWSVLMMLFFHLKKVFYAQEQIYG